MSAKTQAGAASSREFVTLMIADQMFGVAVTAIHEVFQPQGVSPVPLAEPAAPPMAVGIEKNGESYGILVDSVDEVLKLPDSACEPAPVNLDPRWAAVAMGVYRLDGRLLIALDVERLLDFGPQALAA